MWKIDRDISEETSNAKLSCNVFLACQESRLATSYIQYKMHEQRGRWGEEMQREATEIREE